jgi:polyhydroxyalkanoate synthesis regulator phasin
LSKNKLFSQKKILYLKKILNSNTMENQEKDSLFKKLFYTGIGLTVSTKEKIEKKINELVEKNKITADEGKKIMNDFVTDFDKRKDELENEMKKFVKKTAENLKFAKKKDVEALNKRLDEIESKLEGTTTNEDLNIE